MITEAAINSGSLHTARFALEQGKTVMAVPGSITSPISEGCNNLIKSGAVPVTEAEDVLFALKISPAEKNKKQLFSGSVVEKTVYDLIKQGVGAQEELALTAKLDGHQLASTITMLEISGYIRPAGGGHWIAN
jgi:DNA processing protein